VSIQTRDLFHIFVWALLGLVCHILLSQLVYLLDALSYIVPSEPCFPHTYILYVDTCSLSRKNDLVQTIRSKDPTYRQGPWQVCGWVVGIESGIVSVTGAGIGFVIGVLVWVGIVIVIGVRIGVRIGVGIVIQVRI